MANETKLNLTLADPEKNNHLYRSLAVLQGSTSTSMRNKGVTGHGGNSQRGSKRPIEEVRDLKELNPTRYGDWEHKGRCIDF